MMEMLRNVNRAATGSARIVDNIIAVAGAAKSTTQCAYESRTAHLELSTMSAELRKLVAQFKHMGANGAESFALKKEKSGLAFAGRWSTASKEKFETTGVGPR